MPSPERANPGPILTVPCLAGALCAPLLAMAAPGSGVVAVVGPPRADLAATVRIVSEADGVLVGVGRLGAVIARSDEPGFARRLYRAGAWLVVHPVLAGGCAPARTSPQA